MTRDQVAKEVVDRIIAVAASQHEKEPPTADDIKETDALSSYIDSLDTLELAFEIEEEYEIDFEIDANQMGAITVGLIIDQAFAAISAKGDA